MHFHSPGPGPESSCSERLLAFALGADQRDEPARNRRLDDPAAAEVNRRRAAALLALDDELLRAVPGGEDPVMKKLEKKG